MSLSLVIGNKTYSSWSMRAWLAMEMCGVAYEEVLVQLDRADTAEKIARYSPAGRVPALIHDGLVVWDSLAIVEYLNEAFPQAKLWPDDRAARATARSLCAEMHSGFSTMRDKMSMHLKRAPAPVARTPELDADVARIQQMWKDARARFGAGGPFLFGQATAVDCFFAPVATRFATYAVDVSPDTKAYMNAIFSWPPFEKWRQGALAESFKMPRYEPAI